MCVCMFVCVCTHTHTHTHTHRGGQSASERVLAPLHTRTGFVRLPPQPRALKDPRHLTHTLLARMYMYIRIDVCMFVCMYIRIYKFTYLSTYLSIHPSIPSYVCTYVYTNSLIYLPIYLSIHLYHFQVWLNATLAREMRQVIRLQ